MPEDATPKPLCSKCGKAEVGPRGILCPGCKAMIAAQKLPEVAGE